MFSTNLLFSEDFFTVFLEFRKLRPVVNGVSPLKSSSLNNLYYRNQNSPYLQFNVYRSMFLCYSFYVTHDIQQISVYVSFLYSNLIFLYLV